MITPAPTSKIDPGLARGIFAGEAPGPTLQHIVITFPNTSYEMHLVPTTAVTTDPGKRIIGTIRGRCRRVDVVGTGGRYVEPVYGRPRRVQGSIVAVDATNNEIVVDASVPIRCTPTDPRQKAADFQPGQFVSFDLLDGATFSQA